jgi:hypothetical protein
MSGSGFFNRAAGFDCVNAFASAGLDTAMLFDSRGDGTFASYSIRCTITGQSYVNEASDFEVMQSRDTAENIVSTIMGAASVSSFAMLGNRAEARGGGDWQGENGFTPATMFVFAGVKRAVVDEATIKNEVHAHLLGAYIASNGVRNAAASFEDLVSDRVAGEDDATDLEAIDYLFGTVGELF